MYVNDKGRVEPWNAKYDQYGRQIERTDFNAGNITSLCSVKRVESFRYSYRK